jgi:hypothetical protein
MTTMRLFPVLSSSGCLLVLAVSLWAGCGRAPVESGDENARSGEEQKLPFDRTPRNHGISPTQSLVPSTTKLPEGTPIPVRLQSGLSSGWSHAGDVFHALIDEPVVVDGQTMVPRGTMAAGQVLEAKPSGSALDPGYLRIVLVSLKVGGREVTIETSSIFAKGGLREERNQAAGSVPKDRNIVMGAGRHLNFRLAQTVDLQSLDPQ